GAQPPRQRRAAAGVYPGRGVRPGRGRLADRDRGGRRPPRVKGGVARRMGRSRGPARARCCRRPAAAGTTSHLLGRCEGPPSCSTLLGSSADLLRNLRGIAEVAELDGDELGYLPGKVAESKRRK